MRVMSFVLLLISFLAVDVDLTTHWYLRGTSSTMTPSMTSTMSSTSRVLSHTSIAT
jgi:hypothetical protein